MRTQREGGCQLAPRLWPQGTLGHPSSSPPPSTNWESRKCLPDASLASLCWSRAVTSREWFPEKAHLPTHPRGLLRRPRVPGWPGQWLQDEKPGWEAGSFCLKPHPPLCFHFRSLNTFGQWNPPPPPRLLGVWQDLLRKVWPSLGSLWRTHANSLRSWRPEWLLVQHSWLTLLEPGHCPVLVPTMTSTAGRWVGLAERPPQPLQTHSTTGHPARLARDRNGVRVLSQSRCREGGSSKGGEPREPSRRGSRQPAQPPLPRTRKPGRLHLETTPSPRSLSGTPKVMRGLLSEFLAVSEAPRPG